MSSVVISGDTSGAITIAAPAVAGTNTATLQAVTGTVALQSDGIGFSQTWQDVTASRALTTTYTNSTGKPIMVQYYGTNGNINGCAAFNVNGVQYGVSSATPASGGVCAGSFIVPPGSTYSITNFITTNTLVKWWELR